MNLRQIQSNTLYEFTKLIAEAGAEGYFPSTDSNKYPQQIGSLYYAVLVQYETSFKHIKWTPIEEISSSPEEIETFNNTIKIVEEYTPTLEEVLEVAKEADTIQKTEAIEKYPEIKTSVTKPSQQIKKNVTKKQ